MRLNWTLTFLLAIGETKQTETYILGRSKEIINQHYGHVLPLIKILESKHSHLATSLLYRSLTYSILNRANTKAYQHAAKYLKKLDLLANCITNWQTLSNHDTFKQDLIEKHGRKYSFWEKYNAD